MNKTVIHIDMNAFFASVEQQVNPALKGKPIVICGRGRTVVATCSYEARKYGVKTGMLLYEARKCCPHVISVEGNHVKYVDTARRIHKICLDYTGYVEVFSIDEVFMDVTGVLHLFGSGEDIAGRIKSRIKEELGLPCSAGVAPGKLLAKLASEKEKPDGLVVITPEEVPVVLSETPVEEMCGIGRKTKEYLNFMGIKTLKELGDTDTAVMVRHFGFLGNMLNKMGRGEDVSNVAKYSDSPPVKSVGHSNTLPVDTRDMEVIRSFLLMLSERVGVRLRKYGMVGRTISLHIRDSDFKGFSRQKSLKEYVKTGQCIYRAACGILEAAAPLAKPVRLVGVTISGLAGDLGQGYLLREYAEQEKISKVMDEVNEKYGEFYLRPLSFEIAGNFSGRSIDVPARVHGFLPVKLL